MANLFLAKGRGHETLLVSHTSTRTLMLHDSGATTLHTKNQEAWDAKNKSQSPRFHIPTISFLKKELLLFICNLHGAVLFRAANVVL